MAAAIFLLAIVAAAIAGFVLSFVAAGNGALVSLAIGYLTGSIATVFVGGVLMFMASKTKKLPSRPLQRDARVSPKPPRS